MNIIQQIEASLAKKDYESVKRNILFYSEALDCLSSSQLNELLEYGLRENERLLLFALFNYANEKQKKEIIRSFPLNILQLANLADQYNFQKTVEEYISDFLKIGLEKEGQVILYTLAKIMSEQEEKYKREIAIVKEYIAHAPLNNAILSIACLPSFSTPIAIQRIVESKNINYIMQVLEGKTEEQQEKILAIFISSLPDEDCLRELALRTQKYSLLVKCIENSELNDTQKSLDLLTIYKCNHERILVNKIIEYKNILCTQELMHLLNKQVEEEIITFYLKTQDHVIIRNLAIATNCSKTIACIDIVISWHNEDTMILLMHLSEKYWQYAVERIIMEDKEWYSKIIEKFDQANLLNGLDMINYVFDHQCQNSFSKETLKIWNKRRKQTRTRKKKN